MDLTGLVVDTPLSWYVIEPDRAVRRERAMADVAARAAETLHVAGYEHDVVEGLLRFGADAEEKGALLAAVLWDPGPAGPTVANLLILEGHRKHPEDHDAEVATLLDTLARPDPSDIGPRGTSTVTLPAGAAVRLRFLTDMGGTLSGGNGNGSSHMVGVLDVTQFWVPLGDPGDATMVIVSATTAALHAGDEIAATAEVVARSLRLPST